MSDDRQLRADPDVPEHLAGWYAGDLAAASRAHAQHRAVPDVPGARTGSEPAPAEGGRFLAAWYAGDLASACRARAEHDAGHGAAPGVVRMGRTRG